MEKKSSDPWARSGRGLAGDMGLNFLFFWFFHVFLQFGQKPREHKKKVQTHGQGLGYPHTNQKTKKPKKQKTKKPKKQKNQDCTPQGEGVRCRVLGLVFLFFFLFFLFFWFFVFLVFCFFGLCVDSHCRCAKQRLPGTVSGCTRGRAGKNQKNKKPRNQKNKKPKKPKKTKIAHPKGRGSDAECWVLSFCFFCFFCFFGFLFFWFFGLCVDSHCRCAKQRLPGTVSGCTRSKVDTLQYSNVCYDIVHSANEQQRGMEFNFVRLRHMLLDLCTGNAAICALPQWPVLNF